MHSETIPLLSFLLFLCALSPSLQQPRSPEHHGERKHFPVFKQGCSPGQWIVGILFQKFFDNHLGETRYSPRLNCDSLGQDSTAGEAVSFGFVKLRNVYVKYRFERALSVCVVAVAVAAVVVCVCVCLKTVFWRQRFVRYQMRRMHFTLQFTLHFTLRFTPPKLLPAHLIVSVLKILGSMLRR